MCVMPAGAPWLASGLQERHEGGEHWPSWREGLISALVNSGCTQPKVKSTPTSVFCKVSTDLSVWASEQELGLPHVAGDAFGISSP